MIIKNKYVTGIIALTYFWTTTAFAGVKGAVDTGKADTVEVAGILNSGQDIRAELTQKLDQGQFASQLEKMGIQKSEVKMRLAAMSDSELQQIVKGNERQAGGEVVVIGASAILLIILLVLLLRPSGGGSTTVVK